MKNISPAALVVIAAMYFPQLQVFPASEIKFKLSDFETKMLDEFKLFKSIFRKSLNSILPLVIPVTAVMSCALRNVPATKSELKSKVFFIINQRFKISRTKVRNLNS